MGSSQTQRVQSTAPLLFLFTLVAIFSGSISLSAQGGDHMLYGDLTVDESKVNGLKPLTFDLLLYTEGGILVARQPTANGGRYRFNNLPVGAYQLAIEVENAEIARLAIDLRSPMLKDVRRDISLQWNLPAGARSPRPAVLETYSRSAANDKLFKNASDASAKKDYAQAATLLRQITESDEKDFQAWFELANIHFLRKDFGNAENAYLRAIDAHPGFFLALLNLGRLELSQKRYDVAIEVLRKAIKAGPDSADANYFLGEAYLQNKQGSSAVVYFNEALRLDPIGMAEVHLRLARLYHKAGLRAKAAAEYEAFLKKRPGYSDRKKLEQYIEENKGKSSTNP